MRLRFAVGDEVGVALKPFGAFFAVKLAQTGQVFFGLCFLELLQVALGAQVRVDLVDVASVAASLFLAIGSSDCRHGGGGDVDAVPIDMRGVAVLAQKMGALDLFGWPELLRVPELPPPHATARCSGYTICQEIFPLGEVMLISVATSTPLSYICKPENESGEESPGSVHVVVLALGENGGLGSIRMLDVCRYGALSVATDYGGSKWLLT